MLILLLAVVVSFLIGWLARSRKNRNGVLWGFLTFALMIPLTPLTMLKDSTLGLLGCAFIGIIMALVLAALPATKACPYCKKRIHLEAVVCSHCQSELSAPEAGAS